jgi:hypothetical protein
MRETLRVCRNTDEHASDHARDSVANGLGRDRTGDAKRAVQHSVRLGE